jgi:hypothetical protein
MKNKMQPGDYTLTQVSDTQFLLENRDGTKTEITLVEEGNEVSFSNLPADIAYNLNSFSSKELKENPLACLSAAVREREGMGRTPGAEI